jgi:hypothetical protein
MWNSEGHGQFMIVALLSIVMVVTSHSQQSLLPTITPMEFYYNVSSAACVSDGDCGINR